MVQTFFGVKKDDMALATLVQAYKVSSNKAAASTMDLFILALPDVVESRSLLSSFAAHSTRG